MALSGGVDSAVSAILLKKMGYNVVGVFMKNWSGDDFGIQADCPWEEDQRMAELVANHIGIPFRTFNFEKQYRDKVVEYFFSEYERGRTPNPDVMCNKEIKFKLFLAKALEEGADLIATGHYARVDRHNGKYRLSKGIDTSKDQSYFIYNLSQDQLKHCLFPVGNLPKKEVRRLAHEFELPNASRPDSQGICFIGEINVLKFLQSKLPKQEGDIIDIDSQEIVGKHSGTAFYTIGQRDGLGIGGQKIPYYVVAKDLEKNIVYVGHGGDHPSMFKKEVSLESIHLIDPEFPIDTMQLTASVRYHQPPQAGILDLSNKLFTFDIPQRAVTSGQSLVIFTDDICIGGGVIL